MKLIHKTLRQIKEHNIKCQNLHKYEKELSLLRSKETYMYNNNIAIPLEILNRIMFLTKKIYRMS